MLIWLSNDRCLVAFAEGWIAVSSMPSGVGADGHTTMRQMQLLSFALALAALVVCGYILTRKPRKKLPTKTLRPGVPDEHEPGCFALEEERGGNWTGSGGTEPSVKEAKPSL
jgi:hypothetical protein